MAEVGKQGAITEAEKAQREPGTCSGCQAPIYWVTLASGKRMPLDRGRETRMVFHEGQWLALGAYKSHFASCPEADRFRKAKK